MLSSVKRYDAPLKRWRTPSFKLSRRCQLKGKRRPDERFKIKANRANARASTGPKTAQGRLHAAGNARRHGLSLPLYSNPILSKEVEALADESPGQPPTPKSADWLAASRKRKSICDACATHDINFYPIT